MFNLIALKFEQNYYVDTVCIIQWNMIYACCAKINLSIR